MKKNVQQERKWWKTILVTAVMLCVLGIGIAWAAGYFSKNPHIAKLDELRGQMKESMPTDQRRELWGQMRKEYEQLSPAERIQADRDRGRGMQNRIEKYLAMSPADRKAQLDKDIKESEKRRPQNGNGGGRNNMDDKTREQARKGMLDRTTPEQRAAWGEYRRDMDQRRRELGLPPMRGGR